VRAEHVVRRRLSAEMYRPAAPSAFGRRREEQVAGLVAVAHREVKGDVASRWAEDSERLATARAVRRQPGSGDDRPVVFDPLGHPQLTRAGPS